MDEGNSLGVDIEKIEKGDVITRDKLSRIFGEHPYTYDYQWKLTGFVARFTAALWAAGKPFTVRTTDGEVCILNDADAAEYNQLRFAKHRKGMFRAHDRNLAVDSSMLDEDQRRDHGRSLVTQGAQLAAMVQINGRVATQAYRRNTPGLMEMGPAV